MLPLVLATACLAQCGDPSVPPGGFDFDELFDTEITLSDGETTQTIARWPRDPAGPCGWPLLVLTHGLFGSKSSVNNLSRDFAKAGYFVVSYDVRGHAAASGYHTLWGQRERLDLVEVIQWSQSNFVGLVDPERIGLGGNSQGAILSFSAAVRGGQAIEANPWVLGAYPTIDAIVVDNMTPDFLATLAPQGQGVHCNSAAALIGASEVRFDPALVFEASQAVLAEDYGAWAAIVGDPTRDPGWLAPGMATPILAMGAWDDFWFPVRAMIQSLDQMPSSTPQKLYLGTNGHSSPPNAAEDALRDLWRRDWFDHFLKGADNGIEAGPRVTYAITPADVGQYLSPSSTWTRASADTWPPAGTLDYRLFLRDGAHLWPFPPLDAEATELLHHEVDPLFGPQQIISADFRLPQIEAAIPRAALEWNSSVLLAPLRFAGDPSVHVELVSSANQWQLAASLWDVAPDQSERYVTSGSFFGYDQMAGQNRAIDLQMNSEAYEFPAGHTVRLKLQNMHVHEPPVGALLRFEPALHSYDLEIQHDDLRPSWLTLPVDESVAIPYGWSQINSLGCEPVCNGTGLASATVAAPFFIDATQVVSHKDGFMLYGFAPHKKFVNGGTLFIKAPLHRTPLVNSGGTGANDCSGVLSFDFNVRIQSGSDPDLIPGVRVYAQYWSRDPANSWTTNLTNAVQFTVFP